MGLTFSKIIFGIVIMGFVLSGFIKFGSDISSNSNLAPDTQVYLSSINSSISGINDMRVNTTVVSVGDKDSFTAQYQEAKEYAKTAQNLLKTGEQTPDILIQTLDIQNDENQWIFNYMKLFVGLIVLIVLIYMLFGRKF